MMTKITKKENFKLLANQKSSTETRAPSTSDDGDISHVSKVLDPGTVSHSGVGVINIFLRTKGKCKVLT